MRTLLTLADRDPAWIANAFNEVQRGAIPPVYADVGAIVEHIASHDVVRAASPLIVDGAQRVIAMAMVAVRGERAWIGAFGVARAHRRTGMGHTLAGLALEAARNAGATSIVTAVYSHDVAAACVYRRAAFRNVRDLGIYVAPQIRRAPRASRARVVEIGARPILRLLSSGDAFGDALRCWEREPVTLARTPGLTGLAVDGDAARGYAIVSAGAGLRCVDVAAPNADGAAADALVAAIGGRSADAVVLHEPHSTAVARALCEARWRLSYVRHEMQRAL